MSKSARRSYYNSSSFKMAMLFTVLLGAASVTLGYFMYAYGQGIKISADEVVISSKTYEQIKILGIISIVLMTLVVVISFLISTFVVSRINIIGLTAKRIIDTGDLSRRIHIDSKWDDLSNLAYILNALIERIEKSMEDVRQVSDNIAHDLRTPLARLINRLEEIRLNSTVRDSAEAKQSVEKIVLEAEHIMQTFNALLRISNIAKGKRHTKFEPFDIGTLLQDVTELYEPLAEDNNITIKVNSLSCNYNGDRHLLFQCFANLLDNAIKFTTENGSISISVDSIQDNKLKVIVSDSGIGITDADKEKVFNKFFRAENSRTTPGNGLGLAMVAEIIKLHKGTIILQDNNPGLKVVIDL